MQEIVPDVFTWQWFSQPHGYNFNGSLVRHAQGNLCIDPVEPSDEVLDELARFGVSRILLTTAITYERLTGCEPAPAPGPRSIPMMPRTRAAKARSWTMSFG